LGDGRYLKFSDRAKCNGNLESEHERGFSCSETEESVGL
jgi:hypothetical protein